MSDGPRIGVYLVVITALVRLIAEEVDGGVFDATGLLGLVLEVCEAVCLIPAFGEDVKGDLTTDGEAVLSVLVLVKRKWKGGGRD